MARPIFKRKHQDPVDLWQRYWADRSVANRNKLVEHYYGMVTATVAAMPHRDRNWNDYLSDGALGLIRAVELFDGSRDTTFRCFATPRVRGAMLDGLRNRDAVPRVVRDRVKVRQRLTERIYAESGRMPTQDEFRAAITEAYPSKPQWWLDDVMNTYAAETEPLMFTGPNDEPFISSGAERTCPAADKDHRAMLARDEIAACRQSLPEQDRPLFDLYEYGRTLKEVKVLMGRSESRASQVWQQLRSYIVAHRKAA